MWPQCAGEGGEWVYSTPNVDPDRTCPLFDCAGAHATRKSGTRETRVRTKRWCACLDIVVRLALFSAVKSVALTILDTTQRNEITDVFTRIE